MDRIGTPKSVLLGGECSDVPNEVVQLDNGDPVPPVIQVRFRLHEARAITAGRPTTCCDRCARLDVSET